MPKIERLSWLAPLAEGRGVTLTGDEPADLYLAEDPNALLLGVLLDSQYPTRIAFASPWKLRQRLGHLDMALIAGADADFLVATFREKPALHRFPAKFAALTQSLAAHLVAEYGGDGRRLWAEAGDVDELARRVVALPAFGVEKANWTVGMLGTLGYLSFDGWQDYQVTVPKRRAAPKETR